MDTCQGAGSQPYPSGWIRILITLFGPRSFHSLNIPAVELDKLPTSASLKWRRRDYTRFFYTPTARPIGWTSSVCPRPPEFYSLPFGVRSSKHAPCCGCTDSEQLSGQPVRKDGETLPLDFYGQPIRKDNGTLRLVRPIATTRAQSVIGFTRTFLKDLRT